MPTCIDRTYIENGNAKIQCKHINRRVNIREGTNAPNPDSKLIRLSNSFPSQSKINYTNFEQLNSNNHDDAYSYSE